MATGPSRALEVGGGRWAVGGGRWGEGERTPMRINKTTYAWKGPRVARRKWAKMEGRATPAAEKGWRTRGRGASPKTAIYSYEAHANAL
jgi:hypothetical protein